MSTPYDVLAQLLSPAQADTLDGIGKTAWAAAASRLAAALSESIDVSDLGGRLVMPEEVVGEFEAPHVIAPLEVTTEQEQSATGYLVLPTGPAAAFLTSQADDPGDEEQQTIVVASTVIGQLIQQLNEQLFQPSPAGLILMGDDMVANTMPNILEGMDEPMLALTGTLAASRALPFTLLLPAPFLSLIARAIAGVVAADLAEPVPDDAAAPLPFTLTAEDLDLSELLDEEDSPGAAAAPEPVAAGLAGRAGQATRGLPPRQPTPIASAPAAQRARFASLPEQDPAPGRSNIDLLAGLQMNVTVELGRTELTVADVLGLGPGSVIELDRLAGEPVDILVNDRLIARGEVVVVDENFGVRVVEVVRRGVDQDERVS